MFGLYRIALAIAVATQHLLVVPVVGDHALHGFFLLSGFLMTRVLCETYGHAGTGVLAFTVNRALRLYPVYWVILGFSVVVIFVFGEEAARQYRNSIYLPDNVTSALQNIWLIYPAWHPGSIEPRLSPPTWSLTVEIFFYALMAAGASRNRACTLGWLGLSMIFVVGKALSGVDERFYYAHIGAQSLPFAIGATLYHFRNSISGLMLRSPLLSHPFPVAILCFLNTAATIGLVMIGMKDVQVYATFSNLFLQLLMVASLGCYRWPSRYRPVDRFLGDIAYPVFLLHWQIGFALSMLIMGKPVRGLTPDGLLLYVPSILLSCGLGTILVLTVDQPVQKLRGKLRPARVAEVHENGKVPETGTA